MEEVTPVQDTVSTPHVYDFTFAEEPDDLLGLTRYCMLGREGGAAAGELDPTPIAKILATPQAYRISKPGEWVTLKNGCPFAHGKAHRSKATLAYTVDEHGAFHMVCRDASHNHPRAREKHDANGAPYWTYRLTPELSLARSKFPPFVTGSHTEIANVLLGTVFYGAEYDTSTTFRLYEEPKPTPKGARTHKASPTVGKWVPYGADTIQRAISDLDGEWVNVGQDKQGKPRYKRLAMNEGTVQGVYARVMGTLAARRAGKSKDGEGNPVSAFRASTKPCIPLQGCLYDLHSGQVVLPEHADSRFYYCRSEHTLPCTYWGASVAPPTKWLALLERAWGHQPDYHDRVAFFQEWVGVALAGEATVHETHVLLKGAAMSGKSRVIAVVSGLFPPESVASVQPSDLDGFRLAPFATARLNAVAEVPDTGLANATTMKALQSGDAVQVERKYHDPVVIRSQAAWLVGCNLSWRPSERHDSVFRRWKVLTFDRPVAEGDKNPRLAEDILEAELQSIVAWAVDGYRRFKVNGSRFTQFASSAEAIEEWRRETDPIRVWLEEGVRIDASASTQASVHYAAYRQWALDNGYPPVSSTRFGTDVKAANIASSRGKSGVVHGVELLGGTSGRAAIDFNNL